MHTKFWLENLKRTYHSEDLGVYGKTILKREIWGSHGDDRPDDGGSKHLGNVGTLLPDYMARQPRRQPSSLLKRIFRKPSWRVWIWFMWLRIRTGGGLLWTGWWTLGGRKRRVISWLAERTISFSRMTMSLESVGTKYLENQIKLLQAMDSVQYNWYNKAVTNFVVN
jgi:hypothetical protein